MGTNIGNCSFTGIIPHKSRPWSRGSDRSNVDDRSSISLVDEVGDEVSGGMEDTFYVHGENFVEFIFCDFCRRLWSWSECILSVKGRTNFVFVTRACVVH